MNFFKAPLEKEEVEEALAARLKPFLTQAFRRPVQKKNPAALPIPRPWFAQERSLLRGDHEGRGFRGSGFPALSLLVRFPGSGRRSHVPRRFSCIAVVVFYGVACPTTNCSSMPWPAGCPTPRFLTANWTGCCPIRNSKDFATAFPPNGFNWTGLFHRFQTKRFTPISTTLRPVIGRPWT